MPTATAPSYADTLVAKRAEISDATDAILAAAAEADRALTDDERKRVEGYRDECKSLDARIEDFTALAESRAKFNGLVGRRQEVTERVERTNLRAAAETTDDAPPAPKVDLRSWGERVIESPEFTAFSGSGTSGKIHVPGFLESRAAIDTTTLAIPPYRLPGEVGPVPLTPLLSNIGRVRTSAGTVEFLAWAPNPPSAAAAVAEGAVKPEADITPTPTPLSLTTYAHWKAITRQALEDLPQVRSIVENRLRQGLLIALETAAAAAINAATLDTTASPAGDFSGGIRAGLGEVQARGYNPNAVLLNPADFAALDVAAAAGANAGPNAPSAYWGLRPVAVASVAVGTAFVGDFNTGVTWFDRGDEAVYLSDSHADYFVRNLLVILAEVRAAFAVTEPSALQEVTFTPVPPEAVSATARKS
jgi:hypothetical protein